MCQVYSCIVLVLCAAFVSAKVDQSIFSDDLKKLMSTLHKTCVDKIGANEADIDKLNEGEFVENEKIKCYVHCVMSESGAMDEHGELDIPALIEVVPESMKDSVKKDFASCGKKEGGIKDFCEKAYAIIQCVHEEDPDTFYFP